MALGSSLLEFFFFTMLRFHMIIEVLFGTQFFVTDVAYFLSSYLVMHSLDVLNQVFSDAECPQVLNKRK